jgi:hypothetical protein
MIATHSANKHLDKPPIAIWHFDAWHRQAFRPSDIREMTLPQVNIRPGHAGQGSCLYSPWSQTLQSRFVVNIPSRSGAPLITAFCVDETIRAAQYSVANYLSHIAGKGERSHTPMSDADSGTGR